MEKKKNKKKGKKGIAVFALIIAAVTGLLFIFRSMRNSDSTTSGTFFVRKEVSRNIIEIAGNIDAAQEQTLQSAGNGSVTDVFVKEGDAVKKGDVILQIDDTSEQYNLLNHDYSMDQKRVNGASRELDLMRKERGVLLQKIKDRQIIANFDGIIASLTAKKGDYLEAKDSVGVLIDRSYLKAVVEVVETDAPKLKTGQKVNFTFPAFKYKKIEGYVVSFPAVGKLTSRGATIVEVELRIDEAEPDILPKYSFTGEIQIAPDEEFLVLERRAIGYDNGASYVELVTKGGRRERTAVRIEPYNAEYVKVLSGLSEGDEAAALQKSTPSGGNFRPGGAPPGGGMPGGGQGSRGGANAMPPMF